MLAQDNSLTTEPLSKSTCLETTGKRDRVVDRHLSALESRESGLLTGSPEAWHGASRWIRRQKFVHVSTTLPLVVYNVEGFGSRLFLLKTRHYVAHSARMLFIEKIFIDPLRPSIEYRYLREAGGHQLHHLLVQIIERMSHWVWLCFFYFYSPCHT